MENKIKLQDVRSGMIVKLDDGRFVLTTNKTQKNCRFCVDIDNGHLELLSRIALVEIPGYQLKAQVL